MKAKNIYRIITAALLAFAISACSNIGDSQNKTAPANGKASVNVKLGETARTIMPSYDNGDFTSITLSGAFDGGASKTLKKWTSYADLCDATKGKVEDLEVGAWSFLIECKIEDEVAFTGTLTQPLEAGDNTLAFDLQNGGGTGKIKVTLSLECDASAVKAVTAKLLDESGNDIQDFDEQDLTLDNGEATYGASAPKGTYIVCFTLYSDAEKSTVITRATELVSVAAGLVSSGTVTVKTLNPSHTITYYLNGGNWTTGIVAPASFTEYDEVVLPTKEHIAVRDGYLFLGWYTTSTFDEGTAVTQITQGTTDDITLWAKWEDIAYLLENKKINGLTLLDTDEERVDTSSSSTLSLYAIGKQRVTQELFEKVMGENPSSTKNDSASVESVNWYHAIAFCNKLSVLYGLEPCYEVSGITDWANLAFSSIPTSTDSAWNAATCDFTNKGYRLPTTSEWEFAGKGGDMWEWCWDVGPFGETSRYIRGSKWSDNHAPSDFYMNLKDGWGEGEAVGINENLGFRLVRSL